VAEQPGRVGGVVGKIGKVHYERGASEQARIVASLLSAAIAQVEVVHGRRFAHPVTIGVDITPEAFIAANGLTRD
jgi:hypothetical protein